MSPRVKALVLGAALTLGNGELSAQSLALKAAMHTKLTNAQGLLEAVVRADYERMLRYTDPLSRISEAEIASWQAVARPEYIEQATLFLMSVQRLRGSAAARDIEAAARHYTSHVSSCVRCHTYVRNSGRAALEPPSVRPRDRAR